MKPGDACPHCGVPMVRLPVVYVTSYQQCESCNYSVIIPKANPESIRFEIGPAVSHPVSFKVDGEKIADTIARHVVTKEPK